jgi:putative FmdB family regulatory protein
MPFYEYECTSCKFYCETMQKIADPPLKKCPSCGKSTMKKLISAPNFRLKGGGWYETDFKSEQETKRNLAETEKAPAAEKPAAETAAAEVKAPEPKSTEKVAAKPSKSAAASPAKSTTSRSSTRTRAAAGRHPVRAKAKAKAKSKSRSVRKARR